MNNHYLKLIEESLYGFLPPLDCRERKLIDAMRYSLEAGGKRVRPLLGMECNALCGGKPEAALPFACAVEMVHTYSLIHDDLPCMDDDDLRRGKPSCHVNFGEANALLAGDALQPLAFETMLSGSSIRSDLTVRAAAALAHACGAAGMVGGQMIDLENEGKHVGLDELRVMDSGKTGAIIKAACVMGVIAADGNDDMIAIAESYAENIGIAFQITDDILDVTSTAEVLGKPVESDIGNDKSTYVSLLGLEKAREEASRHTALAVEAVAPLGEKAEFRARFAEMLAGRIK